MAARRITVLSGAGLSAASGIATFRGPGGLWEGHRVEDVATPEAWARNPALVRRFYDARRAGCAPAEPNAGHRALARLQASRPIDTYLVTQNIDDLLDKAGCTNVIEMHGSLWRLRCSADLQHPRVEERGDQDPRGRCEICGAALRPDVVWFGEIPYDLDHIQALVLASDLFVAVGTSGLVYPAAGYGGLAARAGIPTLEINPEPSGARWFRDVLAEGAETALPRLVDAWLADQASPKPLV
jgi:NAD-dependent deacetylase